MNIGYDITERKKLENDLRAAVELRDEFISVASHELKTPLTALNMQLQLLNRFLSDAKETDKKISLLTKGDAIGLMFLVQLLTLFKSRQPS